MRRKVLISLCGILFLSSCDFRRETKPYLSQSNTEQTQTYQESNSNTTSIDTLKIIEYNRTNSGDYECLVKEKLVDKDLEMFPSHRLKIVRNEFFARYGYIFKTSELQDYFQGKSWYVPLFDNVDRFLSETEKHNIELIVKHEKLNLNITDEQFFNVWLNHVKNKTTPPRLMAYHFGEENNESFCLDHHPVYPFEVISRNDIFFVLWRDFYACDQCLYKIHARKYNRKGQLLAQYKLCDIGSFEGINILNDTIYCQNEKYLFDEERFKKDGSPDIYQWQYESLVPDTLKKFVISKTYELIEVE